MSPFSDHDTHRLPKGHLFRSSEMVNSVWLCQWLLTRAIRCGLPMFGRPKQWRTPLVISNVISADRKDFWRREDGKILKYAELHWMRQQLFNIKFIKPSNTLKQPSKKHHTKQLPKNQQKSIITLIKQVSNKHQNHRTTKKQSTKAPKTIKSHRKHQGSIKKVKTVQNTIKKPSQYHHRPPKHQRPIKKNITKIAKRTITNHQQTISQKSPKDLTKLAGVCSHARSITGSWHGKLQLHCSGAPVVDG